jgi:hypothetical protein
MARSANSRSRRPATSPEEREQQLADAAYDLAEEQIGNGTASSQVITHFLKMGSTRERLEQERMQHEVELMQARREQLEGQQRMEEMFTEAIRAFKGYRGLSESYEDSDTFEER